MPPTSPPQNFWAITALELLWVRHVTANNYLLYRLNLLREYLDSPPPPFVTGTLSRFAINRLTDDFSSSMYVLSISLTTNRGHARRFCTQPYHSHCHCQCQCHCHCHCQSVNATVSVTVIARKKPPYKTAMKKR